MTGVQTGALPIYGIFVLAGLQTAVERLISVSQLDTVITIAPTADDGIEMMRKALKSK